MKQLSLRQKAVAFLAAAVLSLSCAGALALANNQTAWAAGTDVTFGFTVDGQYKETDVDLSLIADQTDLMYNFQRRDINNVVRTTNAVLLDRAIRGALAQTGDSGAYDSVWTAGKSLMIYTTEGLYTRYNGFTFENFAASQSFFPEAEHDGDPAPGEPVETATVIALNSGSSEIPEGEIAEAVAEMLPLYTNDSPRLLWGWTAQGPLDGATGGNRLPSNITKIVIS